MEYAGFVNHQGHAVMTVGGDQALRTRTVRGFTVSFEWIRDPHRRKPEAAVVIWPALRKTDGGVWAVTRRAVSKFTDPQNRPMPQAFVEAAQALEIMGMDSLVKADVARLVDVLMDSLDELIQMPATPASVKQDLAPEPMFTIERKEFRTGRVLTETEK